MPYKIYLNSRSMYSNTQSFGSFRRKTTAQCLVNKLAWSLHNLSGPGPEERGLIVFKGSP